MKFSINKHINVAKFSATRNDNTLSKNVVQMKYEIKNKAVKTVNIIISGLTTGKNKKRSKFEE
jgi:hypothetical protein